MEIIVRSGSKSAKDARGERVHFKEPYFDKAARRVFHTAEQKSKFMRDNRMVQNGDSDAKAKKETKHFYEKLNDEKRRK